MQAVAAGDYSAAYAADARMEELRIPSAVSKILGEIIKQAYALYKLYRERGKQLAAFARYIHHLARVLKGIQYEVPQHALPVAQELDTLVATAFAKHDKYEGRGFCSTVWHLRSEKARLQSIMQGIQQLLPLLTISVASAANASAAIADLQRRTVSLQGSSAEAAAHLSHIRAAVEAVAATNGSAAEVEQRLAVLCGSMMHLREGCTQAILDGCGELQRSLGWGITKVHDSVQELQVQVGSMSRQVLAAQGEMSADMKEVKNYLATFCGMAARMADTMHEGRILAAINELPEGGGVTESPDPDANVNATLAAAMREAILAGKLAITACLVLGVPLMPEGPLRPVTLPCCGFAVSHAGAQKLLEAGQCQLCKAPLAAGAQVQENEAVAASVLAEGHGFAPRLFRTDDVTIDTSRKIGSGGEGRVVRGELRGRPVAVKQIPMDAVVGAKDVAGVKHVVTTSYIAGVASPYVCKLHGYCWTDSELWLLMELCDGTLTNLVRRAKEECNLPGLPPVDTVTLGLMLCSALGAVHRSARSLHLDVTPGNVLIKAPCSYDACNLDMAGGAVWGVRLADFGLSKRLPSCVHSSLAAAQRSLISGVAQGTSGYAPREQLEGEGQRRSDVYSLGATLLYAATGVHPFGGASAQAIMYKLCKGTAMEVPDYVKPAALRTLLTDMMAVQAESRPHLAEVQQRLQAMHSTQQAEGAQARFLCGVPPIIPATRTAMSDSATDANASAAGGATDDAGDVSGSQNVGAAKAQRPAASSAAVSQQQRSMGLQSTPSQGTTTSPGSSSRLQKLSQKWLRTPISTSSTRDARQAGKHRPAEALPPEEARQEARKVGKKRPQPHLHAAADPAGSIESDLAHAATCTSEASPAIAMPTASGNPAEDIDESKSPNDPAESTTKEAQQAWDVSSIHTVRDLFARLHAGPPGRTFDFGGRTLRIGYDFSNSGACIARWNLPRAPGILTHATAQLSQGGGVVSNVTLALGNEGILVINQSARIDFRNVTIQGGLLNVEGPRCYAVLRDVTLKRCRLSATWKATVYLHRVRALALPATDTGWVCSAFEKGTTVHASDTTFDDNISVLMGATFTGDRVRVGVGYKTMGGSNYARKFANCIDVAGEGSRVTLKNSDITASPDLGPKRQAAGKPTCGVVAGEKGEVDLTGCTVKGLQRGIELQSGACAVLRNCHVDATENGLGVSGPDTRVEAVGGSISGSLAAVATSTSVNEANVSFERCEVGRQRTF